MKGVIIGLISGIIFSFGLVYSGMTNPEKVIYFLDIFGKWDPALTFVMGGAVTFNILAFYFIFKKGKIRFLTKVLDLPLKKEADKKI